MKKKDILVVLGVIILIVCCLCIYYLINSKKKETIIITDNIKFTQEYTKVPEDNAFTYRNVDEIINILKNGTGVVFLGFPECPWCQQYAVYVNEIAREVGINKIYYYNIKEDRKNNTDKYKEIVNILGDNLANDDEGNKRIFVPDVTFVAKGTIVGHDNESSYDVTGTPEEYWTEEKLSSLKDRLKSYMEQVKTEECKSCEE